MMHSLCFCVFTGNNQVSTKFKDYCHYQSVTSGQGSIQKPMNKVAELNKQDEKHKPVQSDKARTKPNCRSLGKNAFHYWSTRPTTVAPGSDHYFPKGCLRLSVLVFQNFKIKRKSLPARNVGWPSWSLATPPVM